MPTYCYRCKTCALVQVTVQSMKDDPLTDCVVCETPTLERLIYEVGVQYKGSDFPSNDFKKDK